tara:strand:- start:382 stop:855 length:474 start_codon:yes stop_codon:yes gene_type:complete
MNEDNLNNFAISEEMYSWICDNIPFKSTILEFGSGTGTIELTNHYTVYSVEQNIKYVGVAEDSNYIHAPLIGGWYNTEIVFNNIPKNYDLLLIDGPVGSNYRNNIKHYWDKFNTNIPIIFDDTHRYPELKLAQESAKLLNKNISIVEGHQKSFGLLT